MVELAHARLNETLIDETVTTSSILTKDKILSMLSRWESMLYEFREDAVIMNSDLMYFLEAIEDDRQTVKRIFNARHNYVARRVSQISQRDDDKMKMRNTAAAVSGGDMTDDNGDILKPLLRNTDL